MLTIRRKQRDVLALRHQRDFLERLACHLATSYPSWYEERGSSEARDFVRRAVERAGEKNIRGRLSVYTFLELMVEFGESFERSPDQKWAIEILTHPSLPDRLKVDLLSERMRARTGGRRVVEFEAGEAG